MRDWLDHPEIEGDLLPDGYVWRSDVEYDATSEALQNYIRTSSRKLRNTDKKARDWLPIAEHVYGPHPCVYREGEDPGPCLPARNFGRALDELGLGTFPGFREEWKP